MADRFPERFFNRPLDKAWICNTGYDALGAGHLPSSPVLNFKFFSVK